MSTEELAERYAAALYLIHRYRHVMEVFRAVRDGEPAGDEGGALAMIQEDLDRTGRAFLETKELEEKARS